MTCRVFFTSIKRDSGTGGGRCRHVHHGQQVTKTWGSSRRSAERFWSSPVKFLDGTQNQTRELRSWSTLLYSVVFFFGSSRMMQGRGCQKDIFLVTSLWRTTHATTTCSKNLSPRNVNAPKNPEGSEINATFKAIVLDSSLDKVTHNDALLLFSVSQLTKVIFAYGYSTSH